MKNLLLVTFVRAAFLAASASITQAVPWGYVDVLDSNGIVYGWAADTANPAVPISIHFYVDQLDPSHYAGRVEPFEQYDRTDVWQTLNWPAANHGFAFIIPNTSPNDPNVSFNLRNNTTHTVYAYAIGLDGTVAQLGGSFNTPVLSNLSVSLTQPLSTDGKFIIAPNQLAGHLSYHPPPDLTTSINGHIEGSFDRFDYWPNLNSQIRQITAGYGTWGFEIGNMQGATLQKFRAGGIPVSVEIPSCGICADGKDLAREEFEGMPSDPYFWNQHFGITGAEANRQNQDGVGWFRTRAGPRYTPEEIVLDHRLDALSPGYDVTSLINSASSGDTWESRKAAAFYDPCPAATNFNSGIGRIPGLISDYVEYAQAMKLHFTPEPAPRFSFHWPVSPGMEWKDVMWLDQTYAMYSSPADFVNALIYVLNPRYQATEYLKQLVETLCANGTCPDTVYMDTDFTYLSDYTLNSLRRNKAVLEARNVKMGIDLVDPCTDETRAAMLNPPPGSGLSPRDCVVTITPDGHWLHTEGRDPAQYTPNMLYEESVLNVTNFLVVNGIIDRNTKVRMESWYRRPIEVNSGINENNVGFAHAANRVINEYLNPQGFDRSWHQDGLAATYFDNVDFTGTTITRRDPTVNFDWGVGAPDPAMGPDDFSVRWEGQVWAGYSETYTFYTVSDDGVRLWVNNQLLVDNWGDHGPTENSGTITLAAGQKYNIKIEYYEHGGGATMKLLWSSQIG